MHNLRKELEKYVKHLEKEAGKTAEAGSDILLSNQQAADVLQSRVLTLREIIKDLNNILSNNTY